jgi:putative membrane protein
MRDSIKKIDSREFLANERTFMAWVRTGIAIMAFGFVVVKFSLFLRQFALLLPMAEHLPQTGYSSMIGFAIFVIGTLIVPFAFLRYRQVNKQLEKGQFTNSQALPIFLTILLILVSIVLVIYLFSNII